VISLGGWFLLRVKSIRKPELWCPVHLTIPSPLTQALIPSAYPNYVKDKNGDWDCSKWSLMDVIHFELIPYTWNFRWIRHVSQVPYTEWLDDRVFTGLLNHDLIDNSACIIIWMFFKPFAVLNACASKVESVIKGRHHRALVFGVVCVGILTAELFMNESPYPKLWLTFYVRIWLRHSWVGLEDLLDWQWKYTGEYNVSDLEYMSSHQHFLGWIITPPT